MIDPPIDPARSKLMSRVRAGNTKPEMIVRRVLHALGLRFRLHRRDLPGTPDIVLPRHRLAIFVHGCFWHRHEGCAKTTTPKTRETFWQQKFDRNVARDRRNLEQLTELGWRSSIVWECETGNLPALSTKLATLLASVALPGDVPSRPMGEARGD